MTKRIFDAAGREQEAFQAMLGFNDQAQLQVLWPKEQLTVAPNEVRYLRVIQLRVANPAGELGNAARNAFREKIKNGTPLDLLFPRADKNRPNEDATAQIVAISGYVKLNVTS